MKLEDTYAARYELLVKIAADINVNLTAILANYPRVDIVKARAKSVDRFMKKTGKLDPDTGKPYYDDPLSEIQDQVGARVVVYYLDDVQPLVQHLLKHFCEIENKRKDIKDPAKFGYEGHHLVCTLPVDISNRYSPPVRFFELQIQTLFQHAWAEAEHDIGYKMTRALSYEELRSIAYSASQAWGADQCFDRLWKAVLYRTSQ